MLPPLAEDSLSRLSHAEGFTIAIPKKENGFYEKTFIFPSATVWDPSYTRFLSLRAVKFDLFQEKCICHLRTGETKVASLTQRQIEKVKKAITLSDCFDLLPFIVYPILSPPFADNSCLLAIQQISSAMPLKDRSLEIDQKLNALIQVFEDSVEGIWREIESQLTAKEKALLSKKSIDKAIIETTDALRQLNPKNKDTQKESTLGKLIKKLENLTFAFERLDADTTIQELEQIKAAVEKGLGVREALNNLQLQARGFFLLQSDQTLPEIAILAINEKIKRLQESAPIEEISKIEEELTAHFLDDSLIPSFFYSIDNPSLYFLWTQYRCAVFALAFVRESAIENRANSMKELWLSCRQDISYETAGTQSSDEKRQ